MRLRSAVSCVSLLFASSALGQAGRAILTGTITDVDGQPLQGARCDLCQRLSMLHDGKVMIRRQIEYAQHLIELLTVLPGNHDAHNKAVRETLQFAHDRSHFYSVRAGSEHTQDTGWQSV